MSLYLLFSNIHVFYNFHFLITSSVFRYCLHVLLSHFLFFPYSIIRLLLNVPTHNALRMGAQHNFLNSPPLTHKVSFPHISGYFRRYFAAMAIFLQYITENGALGLGLQGYLPVKNAKFAH